MRTVTYIVVVFLFTGLTFSCQQREKAATIPPTSATPMSQTPITTTGTIEKFDNALDQIIKPGAKIEILAKGFTWSEGPLWLPQENKLIFCDIPPNTIYQWTEKSGLEVYLKPSGYTGTIPRGGEVGSNGLILDKEGRLVLCQHGDRRMARLDAPLDAPVPKFFTIADRYEGKKLNSPNDAVYKSNGDLYFTDPPYGLEKNMDDPAKELPYQGVYRVTPDGTVHLLTKELSRPNGLAFSPDEKTLYIANSDPKRAIWMAYDVQPDGSIANGRVFFDATAMLQKEPGNPDGLKVAQNGVLFATGPGGVLIFSPEGKHLGTIKTGQSTANCAFNPDQSVLYITAHMYLMRVKIK
ncbi:SMP-30/gluconolactonase/LRE family protein [Adhaeribacter pallidiroseus]|uniref:Gluconolactonase n=1 Tax=Adhaeribacter pallidiroseus TaxID=2072847 RepID=A0A369QHV3_9BACT|nr:SMP-30/gluconolactonase/LRE family protein [Adhaeribacter pallidiroseus]RDC63880.1 Gluconolactonase [Adhaeribacter pallidiroseus]